jgi:hypothetical protein
MGRLCGLSGHKACNQWWPVGMRGAAATTERDDRCSRGRDDESGSIYGSPHIMGSLVYLIIRRPVKIQEIGSTPALCSFSPSLHTGLISPSSGRGSETASSRPAPLGPETIDSDQNRQAGYDENSRLTKYGSSDCEHERERQEEACER